MILSDLLTSIEINNSDSTCSYKEEYKCELNGNNLEYNAFYLMDKTNKDYKNSNNYKYCMIPYIDNTKEVTNATIVVGQNPSVSSESGIDKTNFNILKTLSTIYEDFNFYIMVNTLPIIDPNGKNVSNTNKANTNIDITKRIIKLLVENNITVEVVLSCGKSNKVYLTFLRDLFEIIKTNNIPLKVFYYSNDEDDKKTGIQYHMSIQSCNKQGRTNINCFSLEDLEIPKLVNKEFGKIKFSLKKDISVNILNVINNEINNLNKTNTILLLVSSLLVCFIFSFINMLVLIKKLNINAELLYTRYISYAIIYLLTIISGIVVLIFNVLSFIPNKVKYINYYSLEKEINVSNIVYKRKHLFFKCSIISLIPFITLIIVLICLSIFFII